MAKRRVTMQDVADACGVSKVTVSLALKGKQWRMSKQTYERVIKAAKSMGYEHDAQLSKLASYLVDQKRGKHVRGELAYLMTVHKGVRDLGRNYYFYELIKPVARDYGYRLEIYEYSEDSELGMSHNRIDRIWKTKGVQGVFVAPPYGRVLPKFNWKNYAWIAFGESLKDPSLHRIDSDFRHATLECFKQLYALGYKRIGLICTMGYERAMQFLIRSAHDAFHLMYPDAEVLSIMDADLSPSFEAKVGPIKEWIMRERPDAIISYESTYADLIQMGYKVPHDFAFATWLMEYKSKREVSGVVRAEHALAKTSVELLLSQIEHGAFGVPEAAIRTRIEGQWLPRKTTRKRPKP